MMPVTKRSLSAVIAIALLAAAPSARPISGTFALQGAAAKTTAYLVSHPINGDPLDRHIDVWMVAQGSNTPIRSYDVDMTKLLHMAVVSDDFRTFLHIHPVLHPDGHFTIDQQLPSAQDYHIYADATPHGIGKQVFRFDLDLGRGPAVSRDLSERSNTAHAGPYTVKLSTTTVPSNGMTMITVHILQNGKPAKNLHPYLGALAHAVFLNARDLSYVHVHPLPLGAKMSPMNMTDMMEMKPLPDSAISSPGMMLHVELGEPGIYKLWLQFRGGSQLYVAPFVITAT